jgi:hypothetical protein
VGTYVDSAFGTIAVTMDGGALHARWDKADFGTLDHVRFETFRSKPKMPEESGTTLTFVPDGAGGVSGVRTYGQTFSRVRS